MVELGIDMAGVTMRSTLQAGLKAAMGMARMQ
jgi:hypothetical protein